MVLLCMQDGSDEKQSVVIESVLQSVLRCITQEFFAAIAVPEFGQPKQDIQPEIAAGEGLHTRGMVSASALFSNARGVALPNAAHTCPARLALFMQGFSLKTRPKLP